MNKLYNIPNLSDEDIIKLINKFFYNVYNNNEFCQTEAINLLHLYLEYFMRKHKMNTSSFKTLIHAVKVDEEKEYAYLLTGTKHNYDVYLDKNLLHDYNEDPYIYDKIVYFLMDAGHEFYHIVQNEQNVPSYQDIEEKTDLALEVYYENVNSQNKKHLKNHLNKHLANLSLIHRTEIQADTMSTGTLLVLLDELITLNAGKSQTLVSLYKNLTRRVKFEDKIRKNAYRQATSSENQVAEYLNSLGDGVRLPI